MFSLFDIWAYNTNIIYLFVDQYSAHQIKFDRLPWQDYKIKHNTGVKSVGPCVSDTTIKSQAQKLKTNEKLSQQHKFKFDTRGMGLYYDKQALRASRQTNFTKFGY